jgi:TatD DNase family protein
MHEEGASDVGGVMHCFTETLDVAKRAIELGFYISFSGIVTFKSAVELHKTCLEVPLDRMLIETDSPYLAPVPNRGKTNQPAWVSHVAEFIANLKGVSVETVGQVTSKNFHDLFKV